MPARLGKMLLVASLSGAGMAATVSVRARPVSFPSASRMREGTDGPAQEDESRPTSMASIAATSANQSQLPPVLLMRPSYYGTLAAVRALGRRSIPVTTAGPARWTIGSCSRYAAEHVACPATADTDAFIDWLVGFGRRSSRRHVLLPTCDDTAWLYARYREQLREHYHLGPTALETIHGLLHKRKLAEHALAVGLDVPRTWYPRTDADVRRIAREAQFPVLLKPVTQVLFPAGSKGQRIDRREDLPSAYATYAKLPYARTILDHDATVQHPMVQEFFPGASNGIYNISSYARDGKLWGARAGRKILQRPRRLGVGICFEEAPVDAALASGLERLVARMGYTGVFETEFVQADGRNVLIDFNPRFYNQMAFDVARGLPLPELSYFGALDRQEPPELAQDSGAGTATGKVFAYGSAFKVMIASQRLSGELSAKEADAWLAWYEEHEGRRVDAVRDADDPWPARLDLMQMVQRHFRYPGDFVRTILLNR